ncbi:MAG: hypothetical protein KDE53_15845 [Caldilineaceae bacterium]|nr:hypothetical protein [Caldilineaceae bacterium]
MYTKKRQRTHLYWGLMVIGLLALTIALVTRPALANMLPQSAYQQLQAAWQRAGASAQYTYQSTILQTTIPTAQLSNAGRSPQTQRVRIDGSLDRAADALQMQMQVGQQPPIAVKVENGHSYGRQGAGDEWIELEQTPDLFAPGGDPLGFLVAMENVRSLGPGEEGMDDFSRPAELLTIDNNGGIRYAFDLSGPQFANFVRADGGRASS